MLTVIVCAASLCCSRKLLFTPLYDDYWVVGVAPFLGFTMFVSISGTRLTLA